MDNGVNLACIYATPDLLCIGRQGNKQHTADSCLNLFLNYSLRSYGILWCHPISTT